MKRRSLDLLQVIENTTLWIFYTFLYNNVHIVDVLTRFN